MVYAAFVRVVGVVDVHEATAIIVLTVDVVEAGGMDVTNHAINHVAAVAPVIFVELVEQGVVEVRENTAASSMQASKRAHTMLRDDVHVVRKTAAVANISAFDCSELTTATAAVVLQVAELVHVVVAVGGLHNGGVGVGIAGIAIHAGNESAIGDSAVFFKIAGASVPGVHKTSTSTGMSTAKVVHAVLREVAGKGIHIVHDTAAHAVVHASDCVVLTAASAVLVVQVEVVHVGFALSRRRKLWHRHPR